MSESSLNFNYLFDFDNFKIVDDVTKDFGRPTRKNSVYSKLDAAKQQQKLENKSVEAEETKCDRRLSTKKVNYHVFDQALT